MKRKKVSRSKMEKALQNLERRRDRRRKKILKIQILREALMNW
jgi:hypothetical protein